MWVQTVNLTKMESVEIFVVDSKSSQNQGNPENWWEQTPDKHPFSSLTVNKGVFEHKDISVENNANGQESIADIDEVDGEVEENTKMDIVMMCASTSKDSNSDDANRVEDAKKRIQQDHPI